MSKPAELISMESSADEQPGAADEARTESGPRSLSRTLRLLEHIALGEGDFTLARLSAELQIPKSSLLGLLRPLCNLSYVIQTKGTYQLGPAAYRLGLAIMPSVSVARIAAPIMRELVDQCNETVLIGTLDRAMGRVTYIEKLESSRSIRYTVDLGTSRPLYCSAAGRVLLAFADEEYIEEYFRTEKFVALTPQTLTKPADLRRVLLQVRERGVAATAGEVSSDAAGFAAPIFDNHGKVVAVLAMAAPVSRSRGLQQDLSSKVKIAAESISFGLGYVSPEADRAD
ncbi:MAG: IclR family transcriptional regulator [Ottowia sp.]|uniref:IclR family transcriptional regulator n=1 Tax=Ottowia sp. TaxID=1898956 RepID=UPI003C7845F6